MCCRTAGIIGRKEMATRGAAKAAKVKKTYKLDADVFNKFNNSSDDFQQLQCCAFIEYSGLDGLNKVEDFIAIRRIASGEDTDVEDAYGGGTLDYIDGTDGMVLVTTVGSQSAKYPLLRAAGFTELSSFERGSYGNRRTIKLWGARTLGRGKYVEPDKKGDYEEITL